VPQQALHAELAAAAVLVVGAVRGADAHDPDLFLLAVAVGHDGLLQLLARHPEAPGLPVSGRCGRSTYSADQIKIQTTIKKIHSPYRNRTQRKEGRKEPAEARTRTKEKVTNKNTTTNAKTNLLTGERFEDRGWPEGEASDVQ
jgi:hypothetical protein